MFFSYLIHINKSKIQLRIAVYIGLAIGCLTGAWKLIEHYQDLSETFLANYGGYVPLALLITGITISILIVRSSVEYGGYITYKDSIRSGLVTSLFASLVIGVFVFIYHTWLHPAYISELLEGVEQTLIAEGLSTEEIALKLEQTRESSGPWMQVFIATSATMMMGMMYSFIISAVLKRNPK